MARIRYRDWRHPGRLRHPPPALQGLVDTCAPRDVHRAWLLEDLPAEQLMQGLGASHTTSAVDVARAVWLAATDGSPRLRYAAGADAEELAEMRRALPGERYLEQMRAAVGPKAGAEQRREELEANVR
jgi:hypothetical protein